MASQCISSRSDNLTVCIDFLYTVHYFIVRRAQAGQGVFTFTEGHTFLRRKDPPADLPGPVLEPGASQLL